MNQSSKQDRSLIGSIDIGILHLVNEINRIESLVTTSSCSGRLTLFHQEKIERDKEGEETKDVGDEKREDEAHSPDSRERHAVGKKKRGKGKGFLFVSHNPSIDKSLSHTLYNIVNDTLAKDEYSSRSTIRLTFEPMILHVRCESLLAADLLMAAAHDAGLRRSGYWRRLKTKDNMITAEIGGSFGCGFMLSIGKQLLVTDIKAIEAFIEYTNELFSENERRKEIFFKQVQQRFGKKKLER